MSDSARARALKAQRAAQARFARYLDKAAAPDAQEAYEDAQTEMMRSVYRLVRAGASGAVIAAAIQRAQVKVAHAVSDAVIGSAILAHRDSVRSVGEFISIMDRSSVDIDVDQVASRRAHAITKSVNKAGAGLAVSLATKFTDDFWKRHDKASSDAAMVGAPPTIPVSAMEDSVSNASWMVDRMANTEVASAYNNGQTEGIKDVGDLGMFRRWTEHVSDSDWAPTDTKTSMDSIYLHGQVALPDDSFSMPDDYPMGDMMNDEWDGPPNRPNDRAILIPWKKTWGMPGWMCVDGSRVWLVRGVGP